MKPTDKAILGMVSESPGRNASEPTGGLDNCIQMKISTFSGLGTDRRAVRRSQRVCCRFEQVAKVAVSSASPPPGVRSPVRPGHVEPRPYRGPHRGRSRRSATHPSGAPRVAAFFQKRVRPPRSGRIEARAGRHGENQPGSRTRLAARRPI
jgi:hypothetical protein